MPKEQKQYGVFISYSHEDAQYVTPIVEIISVARPDLVFQDIKEIEKGQEWEPQLLKALDEANLVIVFWCRHSALSGYVKDEYEKAMKANKQILPVLLDDCALDKDLAKYQWIDLKKVTTHSRETRPKANLPGVTRVTKISAVALAILLVSFFSLFILTKNGANNTTINPSTTDQNTVNYDSIAPSHQHDSMQVIDKKHPNAIDSLNAKLAEEKVQKEYTANWLLILFVVILVGIASYLIVAAVLQAQRKRLSRKSNTRAAASLIEELNEQLPPK